MFTRGQACNWAISFPGRFSLGKTALGMRLPIDVACVASVSNRVLARKLERKQKKKFLLLSQLSRRTSRGNACYAGYYRWAYNWATSFPGSSPTRPCGAESFVRFPRPWDRGLRRRTSLHAVFDSWSVEKWLTFLARICLPGAFTCKRFGKLVSFVLSVIHKGYLSENVYLCFPYKDQNCNAKVKFLDLA